MSFLLIYLVFGDVWDDLHVSRLKYNALDDFQEVQTTSTKSSPMSLPFITYLSVLDFNQMVLIFHSFKGGRLTCKPPRKNKVKVNCKTNLYIDHTTSRSGKNLNFIVSTSEITCLAHISFFQASRISNKSDPPRMSSFNGSMNHKNLESKSWNFFG
ncbi:hypothetical protein IGI04_026927 [Brassica rapa subsp. trilocularis]|uniref:Uncharacterized protein n=1 Tax=Brassica rapa subsp. trilocularis TaxID=1813537 RepID=A0ABQ7KZY8_BRACM|nr:hypothetical protein IGI04_026927 [Brassica rapa subsp. trilocularis]